MEPIGLLQVFVWTLLGVAILRSLVRKRRQVLLWWMQITLVLGCLFYLGYGYYSKFHQMDRAPRLITLINRTDGVRRFYYSGNMISGSAYLGTLTPGHQRTEILPTNRGSLIALDPNNRVMAFLDFRKLPNEVEGKQVGHVITLRNRMNLDYEYIQQATEFVKRIRGHLYNVGIWFTMLLLILFMSIVHLFQIPKFK